MASSDSATAHTAAWQLQTWQSVPQTPLQAAPALAAGRGWEQALGVGDVAGKGTRQGEIQQILST